MGPGHVEGVTPRDIRHGITTLVAALRTSPQGHWWRSASADTGITSSSPFSSASSTELGHPRAHRLVRHDDPALVPESLDVAEAHGEAMVPRHRVRDAGGQDAGPVMVARTVHTSESIREQASRTLGLRPSRQRVKAASASRS